MSEVLKRRVCHGCVSMPRNFHCVVCDPDSSNDFDAEHALRLKAERDHETAKNLGGALVSTAESLRDKLTEAERQVWELRGHLVDLSSLNRELEHKMDYFKGFETHNNALQAKLDTAMGLLRSYPGQTIGSYERAWVRERNAFLNTTSTEGK